MAALFKATTPVVLANHVDPRFANFQIVLFRVGATFETLDFTDAGPDLRRTAPIIMDSPVPGSLRSPNRLFRGLSAARDVVLDEINLIDGVSGAQDSAVRV
jgi:hypothetical protein